MNRYNKFPRAVPSNRPWLPYPETVPYAQQIAGGISISIDGGPPVIINGGPGGGTVNIPIPASGVAPGTYGDADNYPWFTVGADGRITDAGEFPDEGGSGASYVPLSMGTEPLTFISDGSGKPILVPFTP